jgi:hypothetical protein
MRLTLDRVELKEQENMQQEVVVELAQSETMIQMEVTIFSTNQSLKTDTDPVSEMLCFLIFRIPDEGQSPETQC